MSSAFTAVIERDGVWSIGYCPDIPGVDGQGRSKEACLKSLASAIELILEDRRQTGLRGVLVDALREIIRIG